MAGFPNTTTAVPLEEKRRLNEETRRVFHAAVPTKTPGIREMSAKEKVRARLEELLLEGDGKVSVMAAQVLARLEGMNAPEVDLKTHLAGMSVEDRRAWLERQKRAVEAALADLDARSSEQSLGT